MNLYYRTVKLTAVFEAWHLGDGNYPPLNRWQLVRLSFEIEGYFEIYAGPPVSELVQVKDAEYSFVGQILKIYREPESNPLYVIEAAGFRFYVSNFPEKELIFREGDKVAGSGRLFLDHYLWVEFLPHYPSAPDLFYSFRVTRIRAIQIPEAFVSRYPKGKSMPTSLDASIYRDEKVEEVDRMEDCQGDELFFLIDLDDSDVGTELVPRTFLG